MKLQRTYQPASLLWMVVVAFTFGGATMGSPAWAQDATPAPAAEDQPAAGETPAADTPEADAPPTDAPATETPDAADTSAPQEPDAPAEPAQPSADPAVTTEPETTTAETSVTDDAGPSATEPAEGVAPPGTQPPSDEAPAADPSDATASPLVPAEPEQSVLARMESWFGDYWGVVMGLLVLLLGIVVPAVLGNLLANQLGMPDYGWKIGIVAATLAIAAITMIMGDYKLGPDLGGGISLIYDLADGEELTDADSPDGESPAGERRSVDIDELVAALKKRIDPSGQLEVTIRQRGKSVEIIMPKAGQAELERIKRTLTALGQLEFRITVDGAATDRLTQDIIRAAQALPPAKTVVTVGGVEEARWVEYNIEEFGGLNEPDPADAPGDSPRNRNLVKRMGLRGPEILVKLDPYNVTGEYLTVASKDFDIHGPQVRFRFDAEGSRRFGRLTEENVPNAATGDLSFLGIILDNTLLTAPSIQSKITSEGTISGRGMGEEEVDHVVSILDAGSLPAALNKIPVSEETTTPQLGLRTIQQGTYSMALSTALVLLFMAVYYRFAGVVACLALIANVAFVVATMLMLRAAFTLPGLAGLVLTVGMSIDANVLIFERMREELARGASLRMAIRNGFSRATTTIIDSNLTSLITGVVLYVIGTDQIKGFAVTLILGIVMSMYTAIFCSRLIFDIAERKGWIKHLTMMQLVSNPNFDFMGKWRIAAALSLALIAVGTWAIIDRGSELLDIDFTGGTSVYFVLNEEAQMDIGDVRATLNDTELGDRNLVVVARGQTTDIHSTYSLDCSLLDEPPTDDSPGVDAVSRIKQILIDSFGDRLETYTVVAESVQPFEDPENELTGIEATLKFGDQEGDESVEGAAYETVTEELEETLAALGHEGVRPFVTNPRYEPGSSRRFGEWQVRIPLPESEARRALDAFITEINQEPVFPQANKIGGRVAGDMQLQALYATGISLLGILGYIWVRFQRLSFGLAAVIALVHDALVSVGVLALSRHIFDYMGPFATALQIEPFQIGLTIVAAILTLIGYSLNDTIVIFDRVREVKGKSPNITGKIINTSVNQTLSRTLLTSGTTLMVVALLYIFGGEGIHGFAFTLLVGIVAGTYSTIYVASPALLWLATREQAATT